MEKKENSLFFTSDDNTIQISFPHESLSIGVNLSGGINSGLLAYVMANYVKHHDGITLVPITVLTNSNPFDVWFAKKIIEQCENITGVTFSKHQTTIANNLNKTQVLDSFVKKLYKQNIIDSHVSGLGLNDYNTKAYIESKTVRAHFPFINFDKKDISDFYKTYNLMSEIFDYTNSCKNRTSEQNYHCGTCDGCKQRKNNFDYLEPDDNVGLYIDLPRGIARDWSDC